MTTTGSRPAYLERLPPIEQSEWDSFQAAEFQRESASLMSSLDFPDETRQLLDSLKPLPVPQAPAPAAPPEPDVPEDVSRRQDQTRFTLMAPAAPAQHPASAAFAQEAAALLNTLQPIGGVDSEGRAQPEAQQYNTTVTSEFRALQAPQRPSLGQAFGLDASAGMGNEDVRADLPQTPLTTRAADEQLDTSGLAPSLPGLAADALAAGDPDKPSAFTYAGQAATGAADAVAQGPGILRPVAGALRGAGNVLGRMGESADAIRQSAAASDPLGVAGNTWEGAQAAIGLPGSAVHGALRELGAPEWAAAPAGLATDLMMPASALDRAVGRVGETAIRAGGRAIGRGAERVAERVGDDIAESGGLVPWLQRGEARLPEGFRLSSEGAAKRAELIAGNVAAGIPEDAASRIVDDYIGKLADAGQVPARYLERAAEEAAPAAMPKAPPAPSPLAEAARQARQQGQPTLTDKAIALTMGNILSGPKTMGVNIVSGLIETANRPLLEVLEGRPREALTDVAAMGRAIGTAWGHAAEAFLEGGAAARVGSQAAENTRPEAFAGGKGALYTPALRILGASDQFIRSLNAAGGYAVARRRGLDPFDALDFAEDAARRSVFEGRGTPVGDLLIRARNMVHGDTPGEKLVGTAAYILTPFVRIPEEILVRGTKMAVSPVTDTAAAVRHFARGNTDAGRAALARAELNGALALGIWSQVTAGNITGMGPKDARLRSLLQEARGPDGQPIWQPHSVRIGGRWYDYTGLGPVAVPMAAISSGYEAWHERGQKPDATTTDMLKDAANRTARVILDASYLKTIGDLFRAVEQDRAVDALTSIGVNAAGRLVPLGGLLATVARTDDATTRDPQTDAERFMARIPGLRQRVPPRLSLVSGTPVQDPQDAVSVLAPMRTSARGTPTPAAVEVARLAVAGHKDPLILADAPRVVGGRTLTDAEQRRYVQTAGPLVQDAIARRMAEPDYKRLPDAVKARLLRQTIDQQREEALRRFRQQAPAPARPTTPARGR